MALLESARYRGLWQPPVGARLDTSHPLAHGLKHCFIFNEGAGRIVQDLCYNLAFTLAGTQPPVWVPGGLSWAGTWSSATVVEQIQIPALIGTSITTPQTLEVWIKAISTSGAIMLLENSDGNTSGAAQGVGIGIGNTTMDNNGLNLIALNENVAFHSSGVALPTNIGKGWTQIAFVFNPNPGTSVFFINGRRVATASFAALLAGTGAPIHLYLGGYYPAAKGAGRVWGAGSMAIARHYTRALTDAEILALSVEPFSMIQSPNRMLSRSLPEDTTPAAAWHTSVVNVWK